MLKQEIAKIEIQESRQNSKIYSRYEIDEANKTIYTDTYNLEVIPPAKDLIIAGCPLKSDVYVKEEESVLFVESNHN